MKAYGREENYVNHVKYCMPMRIFYICFIFFSLKIIMMDLIDISVFTEVIFTYMLKLFIYLMASAATSCLFHTHPFFVSPS
jgi:uncharacterized protein YjiK